jgi:DNA mismatch endonuclease (patch repair protein)
MSRIKGKDTKPELLVRTIVCELGFRRRYRLNVKKLPGCPDLTFPSLKKVVFVHGCFWHLHACPKARIPKTRRGFWRKKLERNQVRDAKNIAELRRGGWRVLVVWECEIGKKHVVRSLRRFLQSASV